MNTGRWFPPPSLAATRAEHTALAREQFFEEGQQPVGLVDEALLQSWRRCLAERRQPRDAVQVQPVSRLRLEAALRRSRPLREAAHGGLQSLQRVLSRASCSILLVDAEGLVVHAATPAALPQSRLLRALARPGVDVSERALGTNAPGLVLRTGRTCTIDIGEHYFDQITALRCAAAPIRDLHGRIAGVLDLTVEQAGFGFDAAALVGLHAAAMQRALLLNQSLHQTLVELHLQPPWPGASGTGLVGLDDDGSVAWLNGEAEHLTGARLPPAGAPLSSEEVLGVGLAALRAMCGGLHPVERPLPNGLCVGMRVRAPVGRAVASPRDEPQAVPSPAAQASLADHDRALIRSTLRDCGGNVSEAARRLGISRGRVYRAAQSSS